MAFTLELADSELRDVVADGGRVRLRFSAAPARDAAGERGWLQGVELTLGQATLEGDVPHAFGQVTKGNVRQDGASVPRLPLPGEWRGAIELTLHLANGTRLAVQAGALATTLADDARFTPDLSC